MRRLLHLLVPIGLLVIVAATAAAARSVAPSRAQRAIVCPGLRPALIPCCGPPTGAPDQVQQALCCPVIADCAFTITIISAPDPSTAGKPVEISGRLLGAGAGTAVVLWQRLPNQSGFHRVAQGATNASGQYLLVLGRGVVKTTRQLYVTAGGATSATVDQQVHASLTLSPSARSVNRAARVVLKGLVTPSHARERILLEQRVKGKWRVIARPRLTRASRYSVAHRFIHQGVVDLRAVLSGDRRNTRSFSAVVTIAVG